MLLTSNFSELSEKLSPVAIVLNLAHMKLFSIPIIDCLLIISVDVALKSPNADHQGPTIRARWRPIRGEQMHWAQQGLWGPHPEPAQFCCWPPLRQKWGYSATPQGKDTSLGAPALHCLAKNLPPQEGRTHVWLLTAQLQNPRGKWHWAGTWGLLISFISPIFTESPERAKQWLSCWEFRNEPSIWVPHNEDYVLTEATNSWADPEAASDEYLEIQRSRWGSESLG